MKTSEHDRYEICHSGISYTAVRLRAGTSRILEGLKARRGVVELREGTGLRMLDAEKN
jgi:hypothetical protein